MELKTIFQMTKTDRYTQDGRDQIAKLQETEDVTYKTGDISQKTGLQKQPDGSWAPPKKGARTGAEAGKRDQRLFYGRKGSPAAQEDVVRARIVEKMTPEQKEAVRNGKTLRTVKEGQGVIDITKEDLDYFEKHAQERKPEEKHPPMVMPKGMHPAEFMKAWEDDAKKNGYEKGQGNEWREHLRKEESKPAAKQEYKEKDRTARTIRNEMQSTKRPTKTLTTHIANGFYDEEIRKAAGNKEQLQKIAEKAMSPAYEGTGEKVPQEFIKYGAEKLQERYNKMEAAAGGNAASKPETQKAISSDDVVTSLDEMEKTKAKTTKNIGGVKVQFDPQTGYKITHKAPTGKEITTGYNNLEEAHQAVMFRLNRIKNGEIPAISEDAAPKIRQLTGDTKIRIRK